MKSTLKILVAVFLTATSTSIFGNLDNSDTEDDEKNKEPKKRNRRKKYDHERALKCINNDYLNPYPLFNDNGFQSMFRISRTRFQKIFFDVMQSGYDFYKCAIKDPLAVEYSSLQARLLLPIKTLAFGVAPKTFSDYFQQSSTFAKNCCKHFDIIMSQLYFEEYLRFPTSNDLKSLNLLHRQVNGVSGLFGSLDCMHTTWKNCPKAFRGSFQGKEKAATIVLEAVCDYHCWFWHAAYGFAGTNNDITIFYLSPLC